MASVLILTFIGSASLYSIYYNPPNKDELIFILSCLGVLIYLPAICWLAGRNPRLIVLGLGLIYWLSRIASILVRNDLIEWEWDLSLAGLLLAFPSTLFSGINKYGFFSKSWLLSPVLCVAFIVSPVLFRSSLVDLRDWGFKHDLAAYTNFVNDIKTGKINTSDVTELGEIKINENDLPGRALTVQAHLCNHRTAVVKFYTLRQGALGNDCGYLFDDCEDPAQSEIHKKPSYHQKNFPIHIQGPWYEFCAG